MHLDSFYIVQILFIIVDPISVLLGIDLTVIRGLHYIPAKSSLSR